MFNLRIILVRLGHNAGRGGEEGTQTDATYLKSFKSGNPNCIFIWTFRIIFYVSETLVCPSSPSLAWDDFDVCSGGGSDPISSSEW